MTLWMTLLLGQERSSAIVARINNEIITAEELNTEMRRSGAPLESAELRKAILKKVATQKLLDQEAKRRGVQIDAKDMDADLERIKKAFKTNENYDAWLARRKMTHQQHRDERKAVLLEQRLFGMKYYLWIQDAAADSPPIHEFVTPTEMKNYYAANRRQFESQEYVKLVRMTISFQDEKEKKEAIKSVKSYLAHVAAGTPFEVEATVVSQMHGRYPIVVDNFDRTSKLFSEPITTLIMDKLKKGETSEILEEPAAIHVIKILEKVSQVAESFEEAQPKIRTILEHEKRNSNQDILMKGLVKDAYVYPKDLFAFDR